MHVARVSLVPTGRYPVEEKGKKREPPKNKVRLMRKIMSTEIHREVIPGEGGGRTQKEKRRAIESPTE